MKKVALCNKEEMGVITKMYPTVLELSSVQNNLACTEDGCKQTFTSQSNLAMHLQKHHKKQQLEKSSNCIKHFHCPDESCAYHNEMHFKKIKYLKQHYLKVHADKSFVCKKCNKGFSTVTLQTKHSETCGVEFTCSECSCRYKSYEALMTHARRKKHTIPNKVSFRQLNNNEAIPPNKSEDKLPKNTFILPKQTSAMQSISIIPVVFQIKNDCARIDKGVQTDLGNIKTKCKTAVKRRSTQQTQTCVKKKPRKSAETQTIGDCILKRAIQEAKINIKENKTETKKCIEMETQTRNFKWENNKREKDTDSSTQTGIYALEKKSDLSLNFLENENIMHSSSQTNLNNLNFFEDSSFGNCNSQTQTDLIFQDEFLQSTSHIETQTNDELDLCSNMYTQTCDDALLSELEFTNIQTQTNWPDYDMFVSTETQTLLTHNTKSVLDMALNSREISHMETQTDMEQLLEAINA